MRSLAEINAEIKETRMALENVHGTETEVYSRIVGYYRALSANPKIDTWNPGQRAQYFKRKMFLTDNVQEHLPKDGIKI